MIFRTITNYDHLTELQEMNTDISMTVPDESYTVRDLLDKFTRGVVPPVARHVRYDDDPDSVDLDALPDNSFDKFDAYDRLQQLEAEIAFKKRNLELKALEDEKKKDDKDLSQIEFDSDEVNDPNAV